MMVKKVAIEVVTEVATEADIEVEAATEEEITMKAEKKVATEVVTEEVIEVTIKKEKLMKEKKATTEVAIEAATEVEEETEVVKELLHITDQKLKELIMKKLLQVKAKMLKVTTMVIEDKDMGSKENQENNGTHMTDMMEQEEEEVLTKKKDLEKEIGEVKKFNTRRKEILIQKFTRRKKK